MKLDYTKIYDILIQIEFLDGNNLRLNFTTFNKLRKNYFVKISKRNLE